MNIGRNWSEVVTGVEITARWLDVCKLLYCPLQPVYCFVLHDGRKFCWNLAVYGFHYQRCLRNDLLEERGRIAKTCEATDSIPVPGLNLGQLPMGVQM